MIIVALKGGHSNQLFQYATGRRLAEQLGVELFMDLQWFKTAKQVGQFKRFYELGDYNLPQKFINQKGFALVPNIPDDFRGKIYNITKGRNKPRVKHYLHSDDNLFFDKKVLSLPDNIYLEGFWQNEKYFKDIRPLLLKEFEPVKPMNAKNIAFLKEIESAEAVSMHVRREDYVAVKHYADFHGLMSVEYYKAAFSSIKKKVGQKPLKIFVFSTDIDWCKENIKLDCPTVFVEGNAKGSDDMRLMKHCKHNILANSSFSWWGAWLNRNPDKIVIAPKNWFQDKEANSSIELPKDWLRL